MTRIKHFYNNYQEAMHVAANRDELGIYDSKKHPFVFYKGYVFDGGRWIYDRIKANLERDYTALWNINFKEYCIGYFDKKHKKVAVKADNWYTQAMANANPFVRDGEHSDVYELAEIPVENIFDRANASILANERAKPLITSWMNYKIEEYKVLKTRSKICHAFEYYAKRSLEIGDTLQKLIKECPNLSINDSKKIFGKDCISMDLTADSLKYNIEIPSIANIIDGNVFNEEEQRHIQMCKFYTKYCYGEGFSWKEVKKNWGSPEIDDIKDTVVKRRDKIKQLRKECGILSLKNREEALDKAMSNMTVYDWREKSSVNDNTCIEYKAYMLDKNNSKVTLNRKEYLSYRFKNVELKLNDSKDKVITSQGAIVRLDDAIKLFNWLYRKTIAKGIDFMDFRLDNIKIEWYTLRHICYTYKWTEEHKKLGYMDWQIQIGCHTIWMEEVKEFCRYYHLEDKVEFDCKPLNKQQ